MCHIFILKSTKLFTLTTKQGGGGELNQIIIPKETLHFEI